MDVEDQVARIVAAVKSRREALALELALALHDTDPASLLRCDDALGHPLLMWCAVSGLSGLTEYLLSLAEGDGAADLVDRPASCTCGHAGQNALMWAATTAFSPYAMKCAVILLRFGASPARQDAHGCTPITHAAQVGNLPMMHLLASISPGTADLLDFQGRSPLHWAAYSGHAGVVAYCIRVLGMNGNLNDAKLFSPLGRALQNNQPVVVHLLCELGVNMEAGFDVSTRSTRGTSNPTFIASELLVSSSDTVNLCRRVVAGASAAVLLGFAVFVAFVARAQVEAMCSERTLNELLRVRREDFAE
ncbi:Protein S-acyltransferase 24 [Porphyridium purpureum]|uniref:Protein S-acyltransferase 24 n=1 Tax=Porphyridium purpureum TaxID=35688 RepID=A0A5J4Z6X7_PORPP|nr:Protein S-acyltransferase 24 [Porphyridium purpureum]|eukprot:POR4845..scf295_1